MNSRTELVSISINVSPLPERRLPLVAEPLVGGEQTTPAFATTLGGYTLVMTDAPTTEDMQAEANRRTVDDVFRIWITPEVERRQAAGLVPKPYGLAKAQVVLNVDRPVQVRLNDEVRAVMLVDVADEVKQTLQRGQPIAWDAINSITDVRLTEDDPNAAHITMIVVPGRGWGMFFDFRYNAARVAETIDAAGQFLATAEFSARQGYGRSFAENLFSATELTAKAMLLMLPFPELLTSKKHAAVASKLNQFGRHPQNVDRRFVDLHNELGRMRGEARYVAGTVAWTDDEMNQKAAVVRTALDRVRAQAPERLTRD
jgi:hypothetical protein